MITIRSFNIARSDRWRRSIIIGRLMTVSTQHFNVEKNSEESYPDFIPIEVSCFYSEHHQRCEYQVGNRW